AGGWTGERPGSPAGEGRLVGPCPVRVLLFNQGLGNKLLADYVAEWLCKRQTRGSCCERQPRSEWLSTASSGPAPATLLEPAGTERAGGCEQENDLELGARRNRPSDLQLAAAAGGRGTA